MSPPAHQLPVALRAIFGESRPELARRVLAVEDAVSALLLGELGGDVRASAARDAHKLAGSLGMFGLANGSESARELERALLGPDGPPLSDAPRLAELVLGLRAQLDAAAAGPEPEGEGAAPASDGRALLIVSPDPELAERLSVEALGRDLRPRTAHTCTGARRLLEAEAPDAAILDVTFGQRDGENLELLEDLARRDPPVPVLVLTASEALLDRVEVVRRGGCGFVLRSRPPGQVVDAASEQIERADTGAAKILAVDDDPVVSLALSAFLEPHGLAVTPLTDPLRFWDVLEATEPDLIVLDLDMPTLNGIDLCRVVRADPRFGQLPIVFLTASTDPRQIQDIFAAGADDYVAKPIVGPELLTRVVNRLDRVRLYRDLVEKDSLTALASRRRSAQEIEALLASADRLGQPASVALIDLDQHKHLNDTLGHAAGDAVLRRFGARLIETFGSEDAVGRWGGDEFLVGMRGMGRDDAVQRVAELLEAFRPEASFSAGVAEYPRDGSNLLTLEQAAEEALQTAKADGRNRVLPAGKQPGDHAETLDVLVVEDDELLSRLLVDTLDTRGYRTRSLRDGQEALEALSGAAPELSPALILLDVDLPGLDGLSVLRRLSGDGILERTRVILLTARAGETEVLAALELGAFDHVAKPFSMPVLVQRVRRALRR